jgi:hypothetical protein
MMMNRFLPGIALAFAAACALQATPTENLALRVLPAPGRVMVDGKANDWDLSGGIFACDDVENQRGKFAVWLHAMYDTENLYLLAHFIDETPLNNPGQTIADYGFAGDSLQVRTITAPGTPQERGQHFTCWKGRDGADVIKIEQGKDFKEGVVEDAKKSGGAQQAFTVDADGKGYIQEIALPWKLLTRDGQPLKAGDSFTMTFEPNFTLGAKGRLSVKELFTPGVTPDRVFTFMASSCWGTATLEAKGQVKTQPVRLADAREFAVKMEKGAPVVDWTGLIKSPELPGFIPIAFTMPFDGYISLNLKNADGQVVRQLLNAACFTKGRHEVKWDGLTTWSWTKPGEPVPAGEYTWSALVHSGIGLKLRGWACNGGVAPWDSADGKGNWGGDHGVPVAVAADDRQVYLGWSGAEAGKAVLACDLQGRVQWSNNRGGIAGVKALAADAGVLYILGGMAGADAEGASIYKLSAKDGSYLKWEGTDRADVKINSLWTAGQAVAPAKADALAASAGKLFLSFTTNNLIAILDSQSGKLVRTIPAKAPGCLAVKSNVLYYLNGGERVEKLSPADNPDPNPPLRMTVAKPANAKTVCFALGRGSIYEAFGEPLNYVEGYPDADNIGARVLRLGREGGRSLLGPWQPDGLGFIKSMAVDAQGKLWVAEADTAPKRVSVWDTKTEKLVMEFFGPSSYGALGGAICPTDPNVMVGQGCEWRLDPQTGRARCTAVITRDGMENARFALGPNGRVYLAVAGNWAFNTAPLKIYERVTDAGKDAFHRVPEPKTEVGDGAESVPTGASPTYQLRTVIFYADKNGQELSPTAHGQTGKAARTMVWSDANGDGQRQPEEISGVEGELRFSGWYMNVTPDLSLYCGTNQFKITGFTACGAPQYDLSKPVKMPLSGLGSADGRLVLRGGNYGETHTLLTCADIATGKTVWTYPDNFNGVHGSHNACPPTVGMIRGSFGPCGTAKLAKPVGNVWVVPTNVGEWHILTEDGFYLTGLFEGDPMKVKWPEAAVPGSDMTHCPPGMGGEDFGGSIAQGTDGKLYVQAGKTAFWNLEVTGSETVQALSGKSVKVADKDVAQARKFREQQLQAAVGTRRVTVRKLTPKFTGNFEQDFKGAEIIRYQKTDETAVRSAVAWDDQQLYLAWELRDKTPWVNGAEQPENLYLSGDTVDFQIGVDAKADGKRDRAGAGDLRLSIGNFKGAPTAVLYRPVAKIKHPKSFSSGVVKDYRVDSVEVLEAVQIKVTKGRDGYLLEAAVPLTALDLKPTEGQTLRGDFGVTFGDAAGQRTRLRSYWNSQHTGIVDDAVFELMLEPKNWGEFVFRP